MISITEAKSKKELTEYIKFSFKLYKDNPYWIPPLISDELNSFDRDINPIFQSAEAHFYLAWRDGKIVGKIAAIINKDEVEILKKNKVRFGWFDVIDDIEVTKALLEKVYELGRKHKMDHVEGPMGFSNLDKVGVLTKGFDQIGTMITWYNNDYYMKHFEALGFVKEKKFIESIFPFANVKPEMFTETSKIIKERYQLNALTFHNTKDIMPYVDKMFDLFNDSYAALASFVPISDTQKQYFKDKYLNMINPDYIIFVEDKEKKLVAFSIVMPSMSEALKKANGSLFPFGWWHLMRAKKHSKDVLFYLIGIDPFYQNKGVTAIIFNEYYKAFSQRGIQTCIRTPELEENEAIHNLWKHFDPVLHKERCTYRIDL